MVEAEERLEIPRVIQAEDEIHRGIVRRDEEVASRRRDTPQPDSGFSPGFLVWCPENTLKKSRVFRG